MSQPIFSDSTSTMDENEDTLGRSTAFTTPKDPEKAGNSKPDVIKPLFAEGKFPLPDAGYHNVGVIFENLTVNAAGSGSGKMALVETFDRSLVNMWNLPSFLMTLLNLKIGTSRPIIQGFEGVVPDGQTCLVLGRPGSGCSTLLRAIANERAPFKSIEGQVFYSNISSDEAYKSLKGDIVFSSEEDIHIPVLSVGQTLDTALTLRKPSDLQTPMQSKHYSETLTSNLLDTFNMPHVRGTKVGNDYIRGVSGGERKRVTLSEILTLNAAVVCWDNCVRGLDSAVALHFLKVLKELSSTTGMSNIVSIYQTSQEMYDKCFDRVIVIYEGYMIFSGRTEDAEAHFVNMGWHRKPRQTIPDFLTACTSPTERLVRNDHVGPIPTTPQEMAAYFRSSAAYDVLRSDMESYRKSHSGGVQGDSFKQAVAKSKQKGAGRKSVYKANFFKQVANLVVRQTRLEKAEWINLFVKIASNVLQATIVGSIFFSPPASASGSFAVVGGVFFAILYFTIFAIGEIAVTIMGRPHAIKLRRLGFATPAAQTIAQMVIDTPLYAFQTLAFSAVLYFLLGLNAGARYFFTFWFIVFTYYITVASMYRAIASWCHDISIAFRYAGFALGMILSVAGFILPSNYELHWAAWMKRFSPAAFALEALLANEFRTRTLTCASTDMVPNGANYTNQLYQTCSIAGSLPGSTSVSGSTYLSDVYGFESNHIWRDVGILYAFTAIYTILIIAGQSLLVKDTGSASVKVFKRGGVIPPKQPDAPPARVNEKADIESSAVTRQSSGTFRGNFTFKNVYYTVQVGGEDRVLLNNVSGIVRPFRLCALMGASGAGKTTLLDTVSQRKTTGKVEGEYRMGGAPLASDFSRKTSFVQQGDIHEPFSTVRECLEFSALLRQPAHYTKEEKLAFVDEVIDLLELNYIADAIIGPLGVEERKRLTIGVELAARPEELLFLDEPTSGLDSQAAYDIVRSLRNIASKGLAILCTIHQPSGDLFEMFDDVLLLARGGHTVYHGPTGVGASIVSDYFSSKGEAFPADCNPAEEIIRAVAPVGGSSSDWPQIWRESAEAISLEEEIDMINSKSVVDSNAANAAPTEFATSFVFQTTQLLKRNFIAQWRYGPYNTTKFAVCTFFGLFLGFYFLNLPVTQTGLQSLAVLQMVLSQSGPPLILSMSDYFLQRLSIFIGRERSGIYSWYALVTALILVEFPTIVVVFSLQFFCYYWTSGLNSTASAGALAWLTWISYSIFVCTSAQLFAAVSPSQQAVPYILSLMWNIYCATSGALVPHSLMPSPYRDFVYWVSPVRWILGSLISSGLSPHKVTCATEEFVTFNIPSGQTCGEYAASYLETAVGYLVDSTATSSCQYCPMSSGSDYVEQAGYSATEGWRDWGISLAFLVSNLALIYIAVWWFKIRPLYKN